MPTETRRQINGRKIAMIFQDTLAHLNPVYSVGYQIGRNANELMTLTCVNSETASRRPA